MSGFIKALILFLLWFVSTAIFGALVWVAKLVMFFVIIQLLK